MEIYKLAPHLTFKVWGGTALKSLKAPMISGKEPLGETWEVSIHPDGVSTVEGGEKLDKFFNPEELSYLIKFIDTSDNLSIQVHPGDEYAARVEQQSGKSECWLILDAKPGAGIYLGLKNGINKEQLEAAIKNGDAVDQLLNFYEVKKGDFFFVPAGSIHALGKDVLLAEIQQSSGVTYRVWDWNRMGMDGKPRALHIDKALDVIEFEPAKNDLEYFKFSKDNFSTEFKNLIEHPDFKVDMRSLKENEEITLTAQNRALSIVNLNGDIMLDTELNIKSFDCAITHRETSLKVKANKASQILVVY